MNNALYLRRRSRICLPPALGSAPPKNYLASLLKNAEALGYRFSEPLFRACQDLSLEQLAELHTNLMDALREAKGAHRTLQPMYPNFPQQVMELSEGELYINALLHYWTDGRYLPEYEAKARSPLRENVTLQTIDLGTQEEFEGLFGQIAGSNASLSVQDKEDLTWFVETYRSAIIPLLPDAVAQKENMAFLAALLLKHTDYAEAFLDKSCRTATDVLRLAVAMSDGDVSLATAMRFRRFTRAERRLLLSLLNRPACSVEEMLRWKRRWIRLGERLHPGEYQSRYPQAAESFRLLRNDVPIATFRSTLEATLERKEVSSAVTRLSARAGEFARRLDHLLRLDPATQEATLAVFGSEAQQVSTPVLLQIISHFRHRSAAPDLRVFFPKGNVAKAYAIPNALPPLAPNVCQRVVALCQEALLARFRLLPPLGKIYVEEALAQYMVPFSQRSASKSLRTIARGSKLPLSPECSTLRFFLWWKNGVSRTDIDLSATLFDADFRLKDTLSYYNLKAYGGCHSGDIVDAPDGASEFIDVTLQKVQKQGIRYIAMTVHSYSQQPFCDLPECFAGWMARSKPNSGEVYEPKTVQDRLDLAANTRIAIPLLIDVEEKSVLWCDMALQRYPRWRNNVAESLTGIQLTLQAMTSLRKPNLYELLSLHAIARGELVASPDQADAVFSIAEGTPFRLEEIASNYLV